MDRHPARVLAQRIASQEIDGVHAALLHWLHLEDFDSAVARSDVKRCEALSWCTDPVEPVETSSSASAALWAMSCFGVWLTRRRKVYGVGKWWLNKHRLVGAVPAHVKTVRRLDSIELGFD